MDNNNSKLINLQVAGLPDNSYLTKNSLFVHSNDYNKMTQVFNHNSSSNYFYVTAKNHIFKVEVSDEIKENTVAFGGLKRNQLSLASTDKIDLEYIKEEEIKKFEKARNLVVTLSIRKYPLSVDKSSFTLKDVDIEEYLKKTYPYALLNNGHYLYMELEGATLFAVIKTNNGKPQTLIHDTELELKESGFKIKSSNSQPKKLTKDGFNFQKMGVGGMHDEINKIFRTAFVSRQHSAETIKKFGTQHVKGILLHGPPGTGKTLIARTLANILNAEEVRVVNGPELFDSYVGNTEKKIRELFLKAEQDEKLNKEESGLHVIIFDEIDSLCRKRGSNSSTGVYDSAVNQLLTKIDGVDSLNNILIIGMTNRKELIDDAMLRPGRLELHVEISLPNLQERREIFEIHTRKMRENEVIDEDVNLDDLSEITKNYTGAEIETVVKRATSYALNCFSLEKETKNKDITYRKVNRNDFDLALEEVIPIFGADANIIERPINFGMIDYGLRYNSIVTEVNKYVNQLKTSKSANLMSVLLKGEDGTGKTSIACNIGMNSMFPYVKLISPDILVGMSESGKCQEIVKIFEDAYKSPLSFIILDHIERIIEYVKIGPRFSNLILQTLLVYIKKTPTKKGHKVMIIGTSSLSYHLEDLDLVKVFNNSIEVNQLNENEMKTVIDNFTDNDSVKTNKVSKGFKEMNIDEIDIKSLCMKTEVMLKDLE